MIMKMTRISLIFALLAEEALATFSEGAPDKSLYSESDLPGAIALDDVTTWINAGRPALRERSKAAGNSKSSVMISP